MDRRYFIRRSALLAAGSAFGGSSVGCMFNEVGPTIPCLGSAQPPVPVQGMIYIKASQIGCALDCDLRTGRNKNTGGAATDDGPRINAAMAGATKSNPITLIIDGSAMISGLFLPAGGFWSIAGLGCGTGFFVKSGTNNDGIHNGPPDAAVPSDPGPPAPARSSNVSLSNFTLNGNRGNGRNGNSTTGAPQGKLGSAYYFGINLMNLNNILIENVVVVNTPAYHMRLSNVGNVAVSGCVMISVGPNTDGLHFDGPANDITISDCSFTMGDDAIALNCPEGFSGNISNVQVRNCTFKSQSLARLETISVSWSPNKFYIDNVTVSNCKGVFTGSVFSIGDGADSNQNAVDHLMVSDCNLTVPTVLDVYANFGTIALRNVTFIPFLANESPPFAFLRTSKIYIGMTYFGSSLSFENCAIQRNSDTAVSAVIIESGSTINNVAFKGFGVLNRDGSKSRTPELVNIESGSIGQLILDAVDSTNIKSPVKAGNFSGIGSVSGNGVLASAWKFPDTVMANDVPYISANTGLPSIKINGVVKSYP